MTQHDELSTADLTGRPQETRLQDHRPEETRQEDRQEDFRQEEFRQEGFRADDAPVVEETPAAETPAATASHAAPAAPEHSGPLLGQHDAEGFRARWTDVQTTFVDSPRESVQQADALVAEVMQHLAKTFADERSALERQWDGGDTVETDELRTAFRRYRSFFERLLAT